MGLKDLAKSAPSAGTGGKAKLDSDQVGLTRKVMNQVATGGIGQANIIVKGKDELFAKHRGPIILALGGKTYNLNKGDTHLIWYSHQKEDSQFTELFDALEGQVPPGDKGRVTLSCTITICDDVAENGTAKEVDSDTDDSESDD